jgi:hypothetical protein
VSEPDVLITCALCGQLILYFCDEQDDGSLVHTHTRCGCGEIAWPT